MALEDTNVTAAGAGGIRALNARNIEALLRRHVIDAWFPHSLDLEYGGFLCDFDAAWKPRGRQHKLLEFQARQTWAAAELLRFAPDDERLRDATVRGFRFVREVMWDRSCGGWYTRVSRAGKPLQAGTKHAHGMAYAVAACVAVYDALGDPAALDLAREGFAWLDSNAHDVRHGGYFGPLTREGAIVRTSADAPDHGSTDAIGVPYGTKDANTHSDLLETLVYLYRATADPTAGARLDEVVALFLRRMTLPSGVLPFLFEPDWTPVPHLVRFGYALQAVHRLLAARDVTRNDGLRAHAEHLFRYLRREARDPRGGFFFAAPAMRPYAVEGHDLIVRRKEWWLQFEALKAWLAIGRESADDEVLAECAEQQRYIERFLIDRRRGGIYPQVDAARGIVAAARGRSGAKGNEWKDASHEARAWLYCRDVARAQEGNPIGRS